MSYGAAAALQVALYARLAGFPALAGVPVLDAVQPGQGPGTFVLIGPEEVRDASDKSGAGADHRITVSVISDAGGFLTAKTVAGHVSDALAGFRPLLTRGTIVHLLFDRASAERIDEGAIRRIDLVFRARIDDQV
jgi:hypothetical protein